MITIQLILLSVLAVSVNSVPINKATAYLNSGSIQGQITFTDLQNGKVAVQGTISGVSEGLYGFHIHQSGDLSEGCASALAHYNPDGVNHGAPDNIERHVGDLGNIEFGKDGVANIDFEDHVIALEGRYGIIGRALVLHEGIDDLGQGGHADSLTTGNAGGRVACTVIGILE